MIRYLFKIFRNCKFVFEKTRIKFGNNNEMQENSKENLKNVKKIETIFRKPLKRMRNF